MASSGGLSHAPVRRIGDKEHAAIEPDKGVTYLGYGRSLVEKTAKYYRPFLAGQAISGHSR